MGTYLGHVSVLGQRPRLPCIVLLSVCGVLWCAALWCAGRARAPYVASSSRGPRTPEAAGFGVSGARNRRELALGD